jgi:2-aminoethylphosphonate dioxygenase
MPNVPGEISIDDVERFHRDGYVVLRNFFDRTAASRIKELSDQFSSKAAAILRECSRQSESPGNRAARSADELIVVPEATDQSMVCRYEYMIGSSVDFRQLVGTFVVPTVSVFLSEPAVPFKDKTNEKHPGGGRFGPHQDSVAYQHFGPRYNITALLSVHTATRANGCLQFAENFRELVKAKPEAVKSVIEGRSILHSCDGGNQNGNIIPE